MRALMGVIRDRHNTYYALKTGPAKPKGDCEQQSRLSWRTARPRRQTWSGRWALRTSARPTSAPSRCWRSWPHYRIWRIDLRTASRKARLRSPSDANDRRAVPRAAALLPWLRLILHHGRS